MYGKVIYMDYDLRQVIGAILWWTEGTKSYKDKRWTNTWHYIIDLTNTNPDIIKFFLDFLRSDIGIDESRLKLQLQIHEDDDQERLETYWSRITQIPRERFTKTIVRPVGNKIGKNMGTCKIRYCDKKTYLKIHFLLNKILELVNKEDIKIGV